jgi:hypothetical protein
LHDGVLLSKLVELFVGICKQEARPTVKLGLIDFGQVVVSQY